jgi:tRNA dimethylallyltransferase
VQDGAPSFERAPVVSSPASRAAGPGAHAARRADFVAIVGPTASGKSDLAVAVARRLGGEVVSLDSRQVYRGMDVGTAKLPLAQRLGVPHHGLDLVDPDQSYSAGRFARDARRWIRDIRARGRVPVLAGGTGFFLRALTTPIFREPPLDPTRRAALRRWLAGRPRSELERWARALDAERATLAAAGGPQRLQRTLEVALLSGRPLSWWHRHAPAEDEPLEGVIALIDLPRVELDRRIDARVDAMLAAGLESEVRALLAAGYGADAPGMTGVGYREMVARLAGSIDATEAAERIRGATRAYARRQATWFRNQLPEHVVRVDGTAAMEERVARVVDAWRGAGA